MSSYRWSIEKGESLRNPGSQDDELEELNRLKEDDSIAFNSRAESIFGQLLCDLIREFGNRLYRKQAVDEMSFRLNISPVTSKRYLDKHTTRKAMFEIKDKIVRCRKCDQRRFLNIKVVKKTKE